MIPNNCGLELIGVADREQMHETAEQQRLWDFVPQWAICIQHIATKVYHVRRSHYSHVGALPTLKASVRVATALEQPPRV